MKKVLLLIVSIISVFSGSAQNFNKSNLGIRLSIDATLPGDFSAGDGYSKYKLYENGAGFSIGAVYRFDLMGSLYVEPGLSLYYNTYSLNKSFLEDVIGGELGVPAQSADYEITKRSLRMFGFRLPVMVGYRFGLAPDFNLNLFTGPMFDFGCSADLHYGFKASGKYDVNYSRSQYGDDGTLKSFNCYWNFGAGVSFTEHFYLSLQYDLGLRNRAKDITVLDTDEIVGDKKVKFHSNLVQLTFGYNF